MNEYRLEQLFDLQMGKTPSRNESSYWLNGLHDWISIRDLSNSSKYISETNEKLSDIAVKESGIKIIPKDTVIMSFKLSIGKVAITSHDMFSNEAIMAFHDKKVIEILPEYLYYLLLAKNWDEGSNKAVMGITLNKATLSMTKIRIHDIVNQVQIASILDNLDKQINNKKKQLTEYDQLIKSRFVEMFGDPVKNSHEWKIEKLGVVCDVRDGTHDSPKYVNDGYPLITSKNVVDGYIDFTNVNMISKEDLDSINKRSKVDLGDILMPMIGTIGNPIIVKEDKIFAIKNVALIKFKKQSKVINIYIKALLESDFFENAVSGSKRGGTQKFISLGNIRALPIAVPPIELQNEFTAFIQQIDKLKFEDDF